MSRTSVWRSVAMVAVIVGVCGVANAAILGSPPPPQQRQRAANVKVVVYYESMCPDSVAFFTNQLTPTYNKLKDIMDLQFVPFGKAMARPSLADGKLQISFQCQHGPRECAGNRVMSCAQRVLQSVDDQHDLFACMMADQDPPSAGPRCSRELGFNWLAIEECSVSQRGAILLYMNGRSTVKLSPSLFYVPTATINGVYSRQSIREATTNFLQQVCEAYSAYHPNCV